jgi:hypothetical protein
MAIFYGSGLVFSVSAAAILLNDLVDLLRGRMPITASVAAEGRE